MHYSCDQSKDQSQCKLAIKHYIHNSRTIVLEFIMVEKVNLLWLGKACPMQVLSAAIDHPFVSLGFTSATDYQKEVLSEFV